MIRAISTPNIALIKYWGNRNNEWRLPAADSLSMVLDKPSVTISAEKSDVFSVLSRDHEGRERVLKEKDLSRIEKHLELTKQYLSTLDMKDILGTPALTIDSKIPPSIGLASSAAIFSCLAELYAELVKDERVLTREEMSVIGRLGSGSGARNVFGGFVALRNEKSDAIDSAKAVQIAPEDHWTLHDIVIIPSHEEKKYGSTEGHALAGTSPLFADRKKAIPERMSDCMDAILKKDFEKLQNVAEEDSLNMHEVMRTSTPSLEYLSEDTKRIVREIKEERKLSHLEVLFTMDAGPTVHLICTAEAKERVLAFAKAQEGCTIFEASIGGASHLV